LPSALADSSLVLEAQSYQLPERYHVWRDLLMGFGTWSDKWFTDTDVSVEALKLVADEYAAVDLDAVRTLLTHGDTPITILPLAQLIVSYIDPPVYPLAYIIHRLWSLPALQNIWRHRSTFDDADMDDLHMPPILTVGAIPSSTTTAATTTTSGTENKHTKIKNGPDSASIVGMGWQPTFDDHLWSRLRTTGFVEQKIEIIGRSSLSSSSSLPPSSSLSSTTTITCNHRMTIIEPGGSRNENRKWLHVFVNVMPLSTHPRHTIAFALYSVLLYRFCILS
jgi:hypothetical protein